MPFGTAWHHVAPQLAGTRVLVMMDLRRCGDSQRPSVAKRGHSKRTMALGAVSVIKQLAFSKFDVLARVRAELVAVRKLTPPLRMLPGEQGAVCRGFDVPTLWREAAHDFSGRSLPGGHYIAEEASELFLPKIFTVLRNRHESQHKSTTPNCRDRR